MINKKKLLVLILLQFSVNVFAAGEFVVVSFGLSEQSTSLRTSERRYDGNGNSCALIKVVTMEKGLTFEGNVVGDVKYDMNVYYVYVSPGTSSISIVQNDGTRQHVDFGKSDDSTVESSLQYKMQLTYNDTEKLNKQSNIEKLQRLAEQGDAKAQCELGICYFKGKDINRDYYKAKNLFIESAEHGCREAQYWLGKCYELGLGGDGKNEKLAIKYYLMSAEQEYPDACYALGNCYSKGFGVVKDLSMAMTYYKKAAELGHAGAKKIISSK